MLTGRRNQLNMAPPNVQQFLRNIQPLHMNLPFNNHRDYGNRNVPGTLEELNPIPVRVQHRLAILAHTRGQSASGCFREQGGQIRAFKHTIMFMGLLPNGKRVSNSCTNCWYASQGQGETATPCNAQPDGRPPHSPNLRQPMVPPQVSPIPPPHPRRPLPPGPPIRPPNFQPPASHPPQTPQAEPQQGGQREPSPFSDLYGASPPRRRDPGTPTRQTGRDSPLFVSGGESDYGSAYEYQDYDYGGGSDHGGGSDYGGGSPGNSSTGLRSLSPIGSASHVSMNSPTPYPVDSPNRRQWGSPNRSPWGSPGAGPRVATPPHVPNPTSPRFGSPQISQPPSPSASRSPPSLLERSIISRTPSPYSLQQHARLIPPSQLIPRTPPQQYAQPSMSLQRFQHEQRTWRESSPGNLSSGAATPHAWQEQRNVANAEETMTRMMERTGLGSPGPSRSRGPHSRQQSLGEMVRDDGQERVADMMTGSPPRVQDQRASRPPHSRSASVGQSAIPPHVLQEVRTMASQPPPTYLPPPRQPLQMQGGPNQRQTSVEPELYESSWDTIQNLRREIEVLEREQLRARQGASGMGSAALGERLIRRRADLVRAEVAYQERMDRFFPGGKYKPLPHLRKP
jgi:hypothetical protein